MEISEILKKLEKLAFKLKKVHLCSRQFHRYFHIILSEKPFSVPFKILDNESDSIVLSKGEAVVLEEFYEDVSKCKFETDAFIVTFRTGLPRLTWINSDGFAKTYCVPVKRETYRTFWSILRFSEKAGTFEDSSSVKALFEFMILRLCKVEIVDQNFQRKIELETLALVYWRRLFIARNFSRKVLREYSGVSFEQMNNRLIRYKGRTLHSGLQMEKIDLAMRMCQDESYSSLNNKEIASKCGFYDLSAMNKIFIKEHGFKLNEYRKALGKEDKMFDLFNRRQLNKCPEISSAQFYQFEKLNTEEDAVSVTIYNSTSNNAELGWFDEKGTVFEVLRLSPHSINPVKAEINDHIRIQFEDGNNLFFKIEEDSEAVLF